MLGEGRRGVRVTTRIWSPSMSDSASVSFPKSEIAPAWGAEASSSCSRHSGRTEWTSQLPSVVSEPESMWPMAAQASAEMTVSPSPAAGSAEAICAAQEPDQPGLGDHGLKKLWGCQG